MILPTRLGQNPLHRIRNRTAAEVLEKYWIDNYEKNRNLVENPKRVDFDSLKPERETAVIVGAGPSLKKNLGELADVCWEKADILCCDKAAPVTSWMFRVKYVTALNARSPRDKDGIPEIAWWWSSSNLRDTTLIAPLTCDPFTFSHWTGRNICPINCDLPTDLTDRITKETGLNPLPGGSNVGVFTYLMAAWMGYKRLVLIGLDYSFKTREEAMARYKDGPYMLFEGTDINGEVRWATWDWFDSAVTFFEYATWLNQRRGVETFNCTEGGILYDGEFVHAAKLKEVL